VDSTTTKKENGEAKYIHIFGLYSNKQTNKQTSKQTNKNKIKQARKKKNQTNKQTNNLKQTNSPTKTYNLHH